MTLLRGNEFATMLRRHRGPVVVWCLAVLLVLVLLDRRGSVVQAPGLVQAPSVVVSPLEVGQLASVDVDLLEEVRRGQVLARLDDERLRAEAAVVAAEVVALSRELELDLADRRMDEASELRRFTADVEQARLRVLELLSILEPDRIVLADLKRDVEAYEELLIGDLVSVRENERVQTEYDALARKVREHEALLQDARIDLEAAEGRRAAFLSSRPDLARAGAAAGAVSESIAARVSVLERRLDEVAVRREDLTMVAPFDGVVVQIPSYAGQVVRPGDPVMTVSAARAEQIVVWLDEASVERLQRRANLDATVVQARDGRSLQAQCPVVRIGPSVVPLPAELWPTPTRPVRGRPVVLKVPPGLDLAPGEQVTVRWG